MEKSVSYVYAIDIGGLLTFAEIASEIGNHLSSTRPDPQEGQPEPADDVIAWLSRSQAAVPKAFPDGRGHLIAQAHTIAGRHFAVYFDPAARKFHLFEEFKNFTDYFDGPEPPEMTGVKITDWDLVPEIRSPDGDY